MEMVGLLMGCEWNGCGFGKVSLWGTKQQFYYKSMRMVQMEWKQRFIIFLLFLVTFHYELYLQYLFIDMGG